MKKIFFMLFVFLFFNGYAATLEEFLDKSLKDYPDILIKERDIKTQQIEVKRVEGDFMPKLNFSSSYSISDPNDSDSTKTFYNELKLSYNIFSGFSSTNNLKIAKYTLNLAENSSNLMAKTIKKNVSSAYFDALTSYKLIKFYEELLKSSQKTYENIKSKFEVGRSLKIDVLKALTEVKKYESKLFEQKSIFKNYLIILGQYTGEQYDDNISLETDFYEPQIDNDPTSYFKKAESNNLELKSYNEKIALSEKEISKARSTLLPSIDIYGSIYNNNVDRGRSSTDTTVASAGILLSWNIFNGNKDTLGIEKQKISYYNTIDEKRRTVLTLKKDLFTTHNKIKTAKENLTYLKSLLEVSSENYKITNEAYELGKATLIEVIKAKDELILATIEYTNNSNTLIQNYISLQYLVGE
ncbi:MAG: TolC family protein [Calditerrivibrio sp.]|nr:TolC family protein [Calditerrivibrio sp.]MCA1932599.1 TolC family protein [Calditerrivibrio sp.]MCA1980314.1 TolC family protein [Calditerrivibrio sp.]